MRAQRLRTWRIVGFCLLGATAVGGFVDSMLVNEVMPRRRSAARSIPKTGCEDGGEIVQDAILMAPRMMDSAEKAGRRFTAGTVSYYAERAARSGRRSYYSGCGDVMSPSCPLAGHAWLEALDAGIEIEDNETATLHDVIHPFDTDAREADPAEEAARNLDWQAFLAVHPPHHRAAILVLVEGGTIREAGKRCGIKDSAALNLRRRIAAGLVAFFGEDVIRRLLGGIRRGWEAALRLIQERQLCHAALGGPMQFAEPR